MNKSRKLNKPTNLYPHIKAGQAVTLKNGACAKRQTNGQFRFVKKTLCKKVNSRVGSREDKSDKKSSPVKITRPGKVPKSAQQRFEDAKRIFLKENNISDDYLNKGIFFDKKSKFSD